MSSSATSIAPPATLPTPAALAGQLQELQSRVQRIEGAQPKDKLSLFVFSGDMDKLIAAFIIATGAAAMGTQVTMFFTFWGLNAVKRARINKGKTFWEKVLSWMTPKGPDSVPTSNMNMLGAGPIFFKMMMGKKNMQTLPQLVQLAADLDVDMYGCQTSMDIMGVRQEELLETMKFCGVAAFLGEANESRNIMFI